MSSGLKEKWIALLSRFTDNTALLKSSWEEIESHYTHKSRAYHNLTHLSNMFAEANRWENHIEDIDVLHFTVWFHDIIYNSLKKDNELRSAEFAKGVLEQTSLGKARIEQCYQQILLTIKHQPTLSASLDDRFLVDFDLEILSRDWESYKAYSQQVRKEYWMYPFVLYKNGRKKAMRHFLERESIYQTPVYQKEREGLARRNIEREIEELL